MRTFNFKFNIGDKVYYIDSNTVNTYISCSACKGKGKITIEDHRYICPKCNGMGNIKKRSIKKFIVKSLTVGEQCVRIRTKNGKGYIMESYKMDEIGLEYGVNYPVDKLYTTEKEAKIDACIMYNQQFKSGDRITENEHIVEEDD